MRKSVSLKFRYQRMSKNLASGLVFIYKNHNSINTMNKSYRPIDTISRSARVSDSQPGASVMTLITCTNGSNSKTASPIERYFFHSY